VIELNAADFAGTIPEARADFADQTRHEIALQVLLDELMPLSRQREENDVPPLIRHAA
jgi:hypothetical protein